MTGGTLIGAGVLVGVLWWSIAAAKKKAARSSDFVLPSGTIITSIPLLTGEEAALYNLLQMAVQDRYLVFTHVPLWSFVSVDASGKARVRLLNQVALKWVDFALVHPGSRQVEQVVQIEDASPDPYEAERQRVIESLLDQAGIKLVKVRSKKSYTIPDLTALLGLAVEE